MPSHSILNSNGTYTYPLSCHCQSTILSVTIQNPLLSKESDIAICTCSWCNKTGAIWCGVRPEDVKMVKGGGDKTKKWGILESYRFGEKTMEHWSCPKCATLLLYTKVKPEDEGWIEFNCRAVPSVIPELSRMKPRKNTTAKFEGPPHIPPKPLTDHSLLSTATSKDHEEDYEKDKNRIIYNGSCHCSAVQFAVYTEKLEQREDAMDCNCSVCYMNGVLWIYPPFKSLHIPTASKTHLSRYTMGSKDPQDINAFYFCSTCKNVIYEHRLKDWGIGLNVRLLDLEADLTEEEIKAGKGKMWDDLLKYQLLDGWSDEPQYVLP